jgi:hypothetical protein
MLTEHFFFLSEVSGAACSSSPSATGSTYTAVTVGSSPDKLLQIKRPQVCFLSLPTLFISLKIATDFLAVNSPTSFRGSVFEPISA